MKFKTLDARMRIFETTHDHCVLPGLYIVARLDGRGFARLTRDVLGFDMPCDERFRDHMVATTQELMRCGIHTMYGYTQSDEISLLFHPLDDGFGRKLRKLNSVLAATASAAFSLRVQHMATFDCRISQLPTIDMVVAYFRWRSHDAHRNALNTSCYCALRKSGASPQEASKKLHGLSVAAKNEMLFQDHGINFNDLPAWHKRGIGLQWESYQKEIVASETGATTLVPRKRIRVIYDLPVRERHDDFIRHIATAAGHERETTSHATAEPNHERRQ